jgi:hypothetical protein
MKIVNPISNFKSIPSSLSFQIRLHYLDVFIAFAFAIVSGVASYLGSQLISPVIFKVYDIWFRSDIPRINKPNTVSR